MIRDQIIVNTPHDTVRSAALQRPNVTLADVLCIAESYEATTKTIATLKETQNNKTIDINFVKKKPLFVKGKTRHVLRKTENTNRVRDVLLHTKKRNANLKTQFAINVLKRDTLRRFVCHNKIIKIIKFLKIRSKTITLIL